MILFYILISTFLISLVSFVGAVVLFLKEEFLNKILLILVSFSAGSLLAGGFFHLLPEAIGKSENVLAVFLFAMLGFVAFFILEDFIHWHHHHAKNHPHILPFSYLILISDAVHNFIDGIVIGASFVIAPSLGIVTALAVVFHEIPQEIGDFGILIYGGFKKNKALFLNFLSAVAAILGGLAGFFLSEKIGESIVFLLPFAAGNFIYIACSDLIPEIKQKTSHRKSMIHFFVFLLGIIFMLLLKLV